jgi:hypothetical protein
MGTMWPFKAKAPRCASFPVSIYKLDAPIAGVAGLVEFSADQYASMGRVFEGERNYNAPPTNFLGQQWTVMLQTVNGQICKIVISQLLKTKQDATPAAMICGVDFAPAPPPRWKDGPPLRGPRTHGPRREAAQTHAIFGIGHRRSLAGLSVASGPGRCPPLRAAQMMRPAPSSRLLWSPTCSGRDASWKWRISFFGISSILR